MFLFSALFVGEDLEIAGISIRILEEISRESCNFGRNFFFFVREVNWLEQNIKFLFWNTVRNVEYRYIFPFSMYRRVRIRGSRFGNFKRIL